MGGLSLQISLENILHSPPYPSFPLTYSDSMVCLILSVVGDAEGVFLAHSYTSA